ncbi:MAG: hypothetical protein ABIL13_07560 [candidate division WOR-3 bacterium]
MSDCECADYMYYWDKLLISHFCIDTDKPKEMHCNKTKTLKVFHAPNHPYIKGTNFLQSAVERFKSEGYSIDLIILQKVPNHVIMEAISESDIVADQFVIGWYAMFAIEGMAMGKPVLCYLREDLLELYRNVGLLDKDEPPIINCRINQIYDKLKWIMENREILDEIGEKGRKYVLKHHSIESMSKIFRDCIRSVLSA